jgi:uroporphyrinogen-III synthase
MNALPLTGRTIVVTRPREQAGELAAGIRACGGSPLLFPLLEISPAADPEPLRVAAATLETCSFAVFVSPNAARYALPTLLARGPWPPALLALAVGPGTLKVLREAGLPAIAPGAGFDSESLLALPEIAPENVAGKSIFIFRGNHGRELLEASLTARGARVTPIPCYQRSGPTDGAAHFLRQLAAKHLDALTLSSSESLGYLLELRADANFQADIRALPLFAPHPRIAAKAESAGFRQVIRTEPTDKGLLLGLCAYNWA